MLEQIFPRYFDNQFRGHPLALFLFLPIALLKIGIGINQMFFTQADIAVLAANSQGDALATIGLAQLLVGLVFVAVFIRYRSMIPLMYALILVEFFIEKGVSSLQHLQPILLAGAPSSSNLALIFTLMSITGFVLSLRSDQSIFDQLR